MKTSPLDGALDMFKRGFKLFPLIPNNKEPAVKWKEWAESCTEEKIKEYAAAIPNANWGVAVYLSGHTGVDIDCKNEKDGFQSIGALVAAGKVLPATLTVKTPSGGLHLYYKGIGESSIQGLAEGIDTRGINGYLVAPGSVIDGVSYEIVEDLPIADLPSWVAESLSGKQQSMKPGEIVSSELRIPKGLRNKTLASLAGSMRRIGMNRASIEAALLKVNETQTEEPLPDRNVITTAASIATRYPPSAVPKSLQTSAQSQQKPFALHCAADIVEANIPPRPWVMPGHFVGGYITGTYSEPGLGKSSLAMLEAVSVATGLNLTGVEVVKQGAVWIMNLEDPQEEIALRLIAISKHYNIPMEKLKNVYYDSGRDTPLVFVEETRNGVDIREDSIQALIKEIKERGIVLLVIDPFVRCHRVAENDNMRIDKVMSAIQQVAAATGCAVNLVHHTGKDKSDAQGGREDLNLARGASAFGGSIRIGRYLKEAQEGLIKKYGLDIKQEYFFLYNSKANLSKRQTEPMCFQLREVKLLNGESMGVVEPVALTNYSEAKATAQASSDRNKILPVLCRAFSIPVLPGIEPQTEMAVKEAMKLIMSDSVAAKALEGYQERGRERRLRTLLKDPITRDGMVFSLREYPKKKIKYYVKCENVV